WQLMFRSRSFIGLTNGVNINDTTKFRSIDENRYIAQRDIPHNGKTIKTGDMIRSEVSRFDDINKVKRQIELKILGRPHSNIIYHLDSTNLSKYTSDEIQSIYTVGR
ncbi:MAG: hypothetical protein K2M98_00040, partial [Muribaculum sp.]|nr:hypothetical protein [Muribaculum sp.]